MPSYPKHLKTGSECPPLKENQLRLYSMHFCPYAQRAKLVLAAKNIPYEEINIDLVDKPEWYLKKNAPGQVPGLEWIDHDSKESKFIPESLIVSDYLDETNSQNRLQPTDPYLKAQHRVLIDRYSSITTAFYKIMRGDPKEGVADLNKNLKPYEEALTNTFFGGSKPAMIDFMLWPWIERFPLLSEAGFEFNSDGKFPKLAAWINAMEANEAVQKVKVPTETVKKFMEGYKQGKPQYDFE
ncbi:unnamed protein product [Adineta steineri]|uniref:Glutathione S-transferase omega n=2 Tax=Adineta steineri TaxID=433720 RepID=A0A819M830_9BILA|nr:unnamed protein product [Adineta steineri]CAF1221644.1 unnamed protein product [Adineta steineri]CAF3737720.1 unnamed protein product [Adineta steineri]CAF3976010.1 unnamed protein product [Adineta steineri]